MANSFSNKLPTNILFDEAKLINKTANSLINFFQAYDYSLIIPPLVDRTDVLLGEEVNSKLDDLTIRIPDINAGEKFAIRADITPQVKHYDEANAKEDDINRFCYCGSTIFAKTDKPWQDREQLQFGAEIYGLYEEEAIAEIILLALKVLNKNNVKDLSITIGHSGLVKDVISCFDENNQKIVYDLVARKDIKSIEEIEKVSNIDMQKIKMILAMVGEADQIAKWENELEKIKCVLYFSSLNEVATILENEKIKVFYDLSSAIGHYYHDGISFNILSGEKIIGNGGCYSSDNRSACGFSINVRELISCVEIENDKKVFASNYNYEIKEWRDAVDKLINDGYQMKIVDDIDNLPKEIKYRLVEEDIDEWKLEAV